MNKAVCGLIVCALLAGCAQMEQRKRDAQMQETRVANGVVCAAAGQNPDIQILREKIPFEDHAATMTQLADASRPDALQKAALSAWDGAWSECYGRTRSFIDMYSAPGVSLAYNTMINQERVVRGSLFSGSITYGDYNKWRADMLAWFFKTTNDDTQVYNAEQQRQNEEAARVRAQNNAAMLGYLAAHPIYTPPTTTSCTRYGNMVSCTTQ
jgi:hypothetical protein